MSDESMIGPELLAELKAQAQWKADQDKLMASLTPHEKKIRAKFERALFGPDGPMELVSLTVRHPTTLLAMAEAYRIAGREATYALGPKAKIKELRAAEEPFQVAMFMLVMIWMAARGHEEAERILAQRRRMPPLPPVPRGWWNYKAAMHAAMGEDYAEPPRVVPLFRTA